MQNQIIPLRQECLTFGRHVGQVVSPFLNRIQGSQFRIHRLHRLYAIEALNRSVPTLHNGAVLDPGSVVQIQFGDWIEFEGLCLQLRYDSKTGGHLHSYTQKTPDWHFGSAGMTRRFIGGLLTFIALMIVGLLLIGQAPHDILRIAQANFLRLIQDEPIYLTDRFLLVFGVILPLLLSPLYLVYGASLGQMLTSQRILDSWSGGRHLSVFQVGLRPLMYTLSFVFTLGGFNLLSAFFKLQESTTDYLLRLRVVSLKPQRPQVLGGLLELNALRVLSLILLYLGLQFWVHAVAHSERYREGFVVLGDERARQLYKKFVLNHPVRTVKYGSLESPEAVVEVFRQALAEEDFLTLMSLVTKQSKKMLDSIGPDKIMGFLPTDVILLQVEFGKTDSDQARVEYREIEHATRQPEVYHIYFKREDGEWKIDYFRYMHEKLKEKERH